MKILVMSEDYRNDQYILQPIIQALVDSLHVRHPKISMSKFPIQGVDQAINWDNVQKVFDRYDWITDLFILCVDRDGDAGRRMSLDEIERRAQYLHERQKFFVAENAWQEIEVWVLAGHNLPEGWDWADIRSEVHPKEVYFERFVEMRGAAKSPGKGRSILAGEAAAHYQRIRQRCPEDICNLEQKVKEVCQIMTG